MLLFFDIDGTIFDENHRLPASVLPAMEAAHRRGHQLFINTGRTLCNMDRRLDHFPLDGWIMGCGTRILYHGKTLQQLEYEPADTLRLRNLFLKLKIPVVYECDTALYFDPEAPFHPAVKGFRSFAEQHGIIRNVTEHDPEFRAVKMFCFGDSDLIRKAEEQTAQAGMPYTAIRRGAEGWELVPSGYSKGKGIDVLCEMLGMTPDDCYAFGDSRNDLTMLMHAGHSIAMGNADEDIRAVCSYVTDWPENNGIRNAMKHFGLI